MRRQPRRNRVYACPARVKGIGRRDQWCRRQTRAVLRGRGLDEKVDRVAQPSPDRERGCRGLTAGPGSLPMSGHMTCRGRGSIFAAAGIVVDGRRHADPTTGGDQQVEIIVPGRAGSLEPPV